MTEDIEKQWVDKASKVLVNKWIRKVRYMTQQEADHLGWSRRTMVIYLSNDSILFASADDEGNDAGALFTTIEGLETIPVIY